MREFYKISKEEMSTFLENLGFKEVSIEGTEEIVYDFYHPKRKELGIRVYTSISKRKEAARDSGEDAIRCIYYDFKNNKALGSDARVYRIKTWETNLLHRLRMMAGIVAHWPRCKACEVGAVAARRGPHGAFWGCTAYPNCKGTRPDSDVKKELANIEEMIKLKVKIK